MSSAGWKRLREYVARDAAAWSQAQNLLKRYGTVKLFGSALQSEASLNGHDFDVVLLTDIKSKEFIIDRVEEFIEEWIKTHSLMLHLWIYGDFIGQSFQKEGKYLLNFQKRYWRLYDLCHQKLNVFRSKK